VPLGQKCIPRCLCLSTSSRTSSFIYKGGILTSYFLVNSIGLGFEALKLTHQSDAQVLRLFKSEFRDSAPILEYGSVVWDNCTREQSDLIESVQYESARIVTGLQKGTSRVKLYG
jgi:hypothetical protein